LSTPANPQPKRYKTWLKRTAITLVTLVAAVLAFYVFVVPPITAWAIQRALKAAGLGGAEYELRAVSLYRLDVVNVRVVKDDPSAIGAVAIDFTPWTLAQGRVNTVRLIGAELNLRVRDGKIDYGGLNPLINPVKPETQPSEGAPGAAAKKDEDLSTLPVDEITLEASSVVVDIHGWKARLAASGSIKKVAGAPAAMFDEPVVRAISQHLAVEFKLDSALVPAYINGWIAPDLDDADILIHLGPQPDPSPAGAPPAASRFQIMSLPFIEAQLSARETASGPTYRINVQSATAMGPPGKDGKPQPNTAGLGFDARLGPGYALKSLSGSGQINRLNLGVATLDVQSKFEAKDGRLSLTASSFKVAGPEGLAVDASLSLSNAMLSLPFGQTQKNRAIEASCDFACGLTAKPPLPGALADILGTRVDLRMATQGRVAASYWLDTRQYQTSIFFENLWLAATPEGSKLIGMLDLKAQKLQMSHGHTGSDIRLASLRVWASQPGVTYPENEIEGATLPVGAAMFQIGHPSAAESGLSWHKPPSDEGASLSLGRAVVRGHAAMDIPLGDSKTHSVDVRFRLPFGLKVEGKTGETTVTLPVAPMDGVQMAGAQAGTTPTAASQPNASQPSAAQAVTTQPGGTLAADKRFLPTDRPRLQWLVSSPYLAMAEGSGTDSSLAGALEIKGTAPVVVRLPGTMPQTPQEWLAQTRIDATTLRLEASPTGEARMSAQAKAAKSSRVSFTGPATLDIAVKPQTAGAPVNQTTFAVALNLPRFTANLSATDSLTLALAVKSDVVPYLVEGGGQTLGARLTPDITLDIHEAKLPTYGVDGLDALLNVQGRVDFAPEAIGVTGVVNLKDLSVSLPKQEVKVANVSLSMPVGTTYRPNGKIKWSYDAKRPRDPGAFALPELVYKNQTLPPISGKIAFYGADLNAQLNWEPVAGAKLNITSQVTVDPALKATAKATLPAFNQQDSFAIARFLEKAGVARAATSEISGTMSAWAQVNYRDDKLTGNGEVTIKDMTVNDRLSAMQITGLTGKITLAELFPLRSEGGQRITARTVKLNEVQLHDADVTLALESPTTVLLERTRARMGEQGILGLTAFRYRTGKTEIDTDLLLENVNIKDLFQSFAKEKLEGDGGIWGRVPIIIAPGSAQPLVIQEGFLFARPGDVGWFKILDASTVSTIDGIADGVAVDEAIKGESIENARAGIKGLKNFSYDKLTVTFEKLNGKTTMVVRASGKGRGLGALVPPLVPTITVQNIDQALGTALNYWYQWTKPMGPPPKPSPLDDMF
jgi:hypothetical protein